MCLMLQCHEMKSPLAYYFSVRLPEGGVENPPVGKGRAWWKTSSRKVSCNNTAAKWSFCVLYVLQRIPWYQVFSQYHRCYKLFGVLHGILTGEMQEEKKKKTVKWYQQDVMTKRGVKREQTKFSACISTSPFVQIFVRYEEFGIANKGQQWCETGCTHVLP